MRIAIAEISQETDTFSPVPTTLEDFDLNRLYYGDEILEQMEGIGKIGGFLAAAEGEEDLQIVPLLAAGAMAGGRIEDDALEFLKGKLLEALEAALPVDGVFMSLHGAASSESTDDLEGVVLQGVREVVGPQVPIVVPLDHHANITELIMETADVVVGYRTQPHKPFETGEQAAGILFDLVRENISPTGAWYKIPMVTPQDQFLTSGGPMKEWFDLARSMEEQPEVIVASTFPMQPWLDVEQAGWTAMVFTNDEPELARQLAAELANKAWELRDAFWVSERVPPADAVRQADEAPEGLIILSDTGDSVYGGAPGDSTVILRAMLEEGIQSTAYVPMVDPEALEIAMEAGEGAEVTLNLGGKMDSIFSDPVEVTARVARVTEDTVVELGRGRGAFRIPRTVLLEVGPIKIAVADGRIRPINTPSMYTHLGLDIEDAKMVVVKTASNFQYFDPWRAGLIRVDAPGMTQSELRAFDWKRAPRPLYPLDDLPEWEAEA